MRLLEMMAVAGVSLAVASAYPATAAEEGSAPPASKIEPGSQGGMERAVNGGDAERGAASKTPDHRAKKAKKKSKKASQAAADTAGAGGSTDRQR